MCNRNWRWYRFKNCLKEILLLEPTLLRATIPGFVHLQKQRRIDIQHKGDSDANDRWRS